MKIEVKPVEDCDNCIFCYDGNWCNLSYGDPCDFDFENGRHIASFCPLKKHDEEIKITDYYNVKLIH